MYSVRNENGQKAKGRWTFNAVSIFIKRTVGRIIVAHREVRVAIWCVCRFSRKEFSSIPKFIILRTQLDEKISFLSLFRRRK